MTAIDALEAAYRAELTARGTAPTVSVLQAFAAARTAEARDTCARVVGLLVVQYGAERVREAAGFVLGQPLAPPPVESEATPPADADGGGAVVLELHPRKSDPPPAEPGPAE